MPAHPRPNGAGDAAVPDPSRLPDPRTMRVDPAAIPGLRRAFGNALTKLDKQIELAITDIRIKPWAGDPVSAEAAQQFNQRSVEAGDSALAALQGYQRQLKSAMDALQQVDEQYQVIEGDNTTLLRRQGGC
ncbi:hypothetical protein GTS_07850 [Gandjariella thermophila]|uniref:Uncharacterized protein n=2 Tax=Gandjariella thermophila TaxID=1931992 RepID=A0A4D4J225_9PSEU|nr:hypothetical protein GTS_07850 [Gandjariella thermophila]